MKHTCLAALASMLAGCATFSPAPVYGDIPECEKLIPPDLKKAVPGVDLPQTETYSDGHEKAEPWQKAFLGQTGQLDKANDRTASVDYIYSTCLKMNRDALAKSKHRFLGVF